MTTRWTPELLGQLRFIGDPGLDTTTLGNALDSTLRPDARLADRANGVPIAVVDAKRVAWRWKPMWQETEHHERYWATVYDGVGSLDREKISLAQDLFVRFGQEIGAVLLLASLPHSYAVESGAVVLAKSDRLHTDLKSRIKSTAQFLLDVMLAEPHENVSSGTVARLRVPGFPVDPRLSLFPGGTGYYAARHTRLVHEIIRMQLRSDWKSSRTIGGLPVGTPINQEHLLGTNLSFSVTVWESLDRLGVHWTDDEKEAYFHLWDWVAQLMGIGQYDRIRKILQPGGSKKLALIEPFRSQGSIRPANFREAEELMAIIRARNWPSLEEMGAFQNARGKLLIRALLDELESAMPPHSQPVPATVMRFLADEHVTVALGLGAGGIGASTADWFMSQPRGVARRLAEPIVTPTMRAAANLVSLHSFVHFINSDDQFRFPGIGRRPSHLRGRTRVQQNKANSLRTV